MATRTITKLRLSNVRDDDVFFCDVILDGKKLLAAFGKGKRGGPSTIHERTGERFASVEAAEAGLRTFLENRGRHYKDRKREEVEVEGEEQHLFVGAESPALEADVLAGREGAAAVYADWLQQEGDPRGELAALSLAGRDAEVADFVARNATALFGDLDVKLDDEVRELDWSGGFLRGASLRRAGFDSTTNLAELTRAFLELPVARLVTRLRFGLASMESDNDWTATMAAVTASPQAAHLLSLAFDDYDSEDCEISWTPIGDFSSAWAKLPALEELRIKSGAGGKLGDLDLPRLRKLVRVSGGLSRAEIVALLDAKCPRLEHLEIWFGSDGYGAEGNPGLLERLFAGEAPRTLTHLGLVNAEFTHELIAPLARSALLPRLRSLDLSRGVLRDEDLDELIAAAPAFRHLERLDLSENQIASRGDEVRRVLPNAVLDEQRVDAPERYVALGE